MAGDGEYTGPGSRARACAALCAWLAALAWMRRVTGGAGPNIRPCLRGRGGGKKREWGEGGGGVRYPAGGDGRGCRWTPGPVVYVGKK